MAEAGINLELQRRFFGLSNRISAVEKKFSNLASQLQIIEEGSIEKHRAALKQVKEVKDQLSAVQEQISEVEEFASRQGERLEEFASKEKVKVLEKYIDLWSPMNFVTRDEVKSLVQQAIGTEKPQKKRGRPRKVR